MSKNATFLVTMNGSVTTCNTVREVSELLGKRVSRKEIAEGKVEGVGEVVTEGAVPVGHAGVLQDDGTKELIKLHNPLGDNPNPEPLTHETVSEAALTEEDAINKLEEIIDGGSTEQLTEEDVDDIIENSELEDDNQEDDNTPEDTEDDNEDTDNNEDDNKPVDKMAELMAKMKELHAKKESEQAGKSTTGKGKRGKATDAQAYIEKTGYPEIGTFTEKKDLQKFYKQLSDEQLDEWIELEGLEYKSSDNEPINRMRKCMAIMALHFPPQTKSTKKKSKYADYTTEELLELAIENGIDVKDGKGDARILRMYTIMELKKAGLLE